MKITISCGNVFRDAGIEEPEATKLMLRADLAIFLRKEIRRRNLTQKDAAKLVGVSQPRISDLVNHKIEKFSIDTLIVMLSKLGLMVDFSVKKIDGPRTVRVKERREKQTT
ncbi:MAG: XRE family transcriptional regulator [Rhodothermia bacterium]|nr:MAG: XRE family transcriptional regulator [Rhodothermia bacterium]